MKPKLLRPWSALSRCHPRVETPRSPSISLRGVTPCTLHRSTLPGAWRSWRSTASHSRWSEQDLSPIFAQIGDDRLSRDHLTAKRAQSTARHDLVVSVLCA